MGDILAAQTVILGEDEEYPWIRKETHHPGAITSYLGDWILSLRRKEEHPPTSIQGSWGSAGEGWPVLEDSRAEHLEVQMFLCLYLSLLISPL